MFTENSSMKLDRRDLGCPKAVLASSARGCGHSSGRHGSSIRWSHSRGTSPYSYSQPQVPDQSIVPSGEVMLEACVRAVSQVFLLVWACLFAVSHAFSAFNVLDYLLISLWLCWVSVGALGLSLVALQGLGGSSLTVGQTLLLQWCLLLPGTG